MSERSVKFIQDVLSSSVDDIIDEGLLMNLPTDLTSDDINRLLDHLYLKMGYENYIPYFILSGYFIYLVHFFRGKKLTDGEISRILSSDYLDEGDTYYETIINMFIKRIDQQ